MKRISLAFEQFSFLLYELKLIVNGNHWRWITCWFGGSAAIIASYRLDRFAYLLLGDLWILARILFFPFFLFLRLLSAPHEIHYRADIGKGLKVLHGSLGIVVSGYAVAGKNLTLTGGNCIGERVSGNLILGDNVTLGVNAVILGPVKIGNQVQIGAGAVVVKDAPEGAILIGVPAEQKGTRL